jgi:hypothetical protein
MSNYHKPIVLDGGQSEQLRSGDGLDAGAFQLPAIVGLPSQRLAVPVVGTVLEWVNSIDARIGCFTCPSVTGNYSVTGLGFRPKIVKFWVSKAPGLRTHFTCCQGMMDAVGNQNSMTWAGRWSDMKGDSRIDLCIYTINSSGNAQVIGSYVSMDSDGFTINFTAVNTLFIVRWEAIG